MKENSAVASEKYKAYEATLNDDQSRSQYATIIDFRKRFMEARSKVLDLSQKGDKAGASTEFQTSVAPLLDSYVKAVQDLSNSVKGDTLTFTDIIRQETLFSQNLIAMFTIKLYGHIVVVFSCRQPGCLIVTNLGCKVGVRRLHKVTRQTSSPEGIVHSDGERILT